MKSQNFLLTTPVAIDGALNFIRKLVPDGTYKVTISRAGSKSAKQRGLDWIWNDDICKSLMGTGDGHFDTKEGVHLYCKWRFAIRIFQRDDDLFSDLYDAWVTKYGEDQIKMRWFIDQHVSTEKFNVSQMAEYLTEKQNCFISKGVQLTEPEFQHLLDEEKS